MSITAPVQSFTDKSLPVSDPLARRGVVLAGLALALLLAASAVAWLGGAQWRWMPSLLLAVGGGMLLLAALQILYLPFRRRLLINALQAEGRGTMAALTDGHGQILAVSAGFRRLGPTGMDAATSIVDAFAGAWSASDLQPFIARAVAGETVQFPFAWADALGRQRQLLLSLQPCQGQSHTLLWRWFEPIADSGSVSPGSAQMLKGLDDAPIGLAQFSADADCLYCNAQLADWLGQGQGLAPEAMGDELIAATGWRDLIGLALAAPSGRLQHSEALAPEATRPPLHLSFAVTGAGANKAQDNQAPAACLWLVATPQADNAGAAGGIDADLHHVLDQAPLAVLLLQGDRICWSNRAFARLSGAEATATGELHSLFTTADRSELTTFLQNCRAGSAQRARRLHLITSDGPREVELHGQPLTPAGVDNADLALYVTDISLIRNLENQVSQSQKQQSVGQLAGGIAHDFNNLMTVILGHCEFLLEKSRPGDVFYPDIMQVMQTTNRAKNLVRQLLAFSRQQTLRPKVLLLTDVLADLTHLLRRVIGERITLQFEHASELGLVKADQTQFEQVMVNLVVNARDAMPDGGTLTIRTRNFDRAVDSPDTTAGPPPGAYVLIEVADTGKGIGSDDMSRIFDPFFSTKPPGTNTGSGTGLGLSTVLGIVQQTGGHIFVDSAPGSGTVFRIYLPRLAQPAGEPKIAADAEEKKQPVDLTGKAKILLVEDEEMLRVLAVRSLQSKGYHVLGADGGEAALALLAEEEEPFDLVISDVVMPQMDGPTLIKRIHETDPQMKVLFISGYAEDMFRKNLDAGREFFLLTKPFTLKELAARVKEVLTG